MLGPILSMLRPRTSAAGWRWLEEALASSIQGRPASALLRAYTAAPRHVGRTPLGATDDEARPIVELHPGFSFAQWTIDDAARAALLLAAVEAERDAARFDELALEVYDAGDSREQQSWLRSLPLLPAAGRFTATAIDACRTNIVPLFESIACENPFPAAHFPERNFNQLVLKALFNAIALERIVGLATRLNPELSRMADDYVSEREAAGRSVPADIWVVLVPFAGEPGLARARRYLRHDDPAHRRWAGAALGSRT